MSAANAGEAGRRDWLAQREKGTATGIKMVVVLATVLGRWPLRLLVRVIAFYYTLFGGTARRAAQAFRRRIGAPAGFWAAYQNVHRFAQCTFDALFFVRGKIAPFEITHDGHDHLARLRASRTGAVLLGAHVGSFYAMRGASNEASLPLHPLVYLRNAKRINDALRALDPKSKTQLVEMGGDDVGFMLRVREIVEDGGLVAILADRVPAGGRSVEVDFLGGKARLPTGPYLLASTLRCPVYLTCGIYREPNRYELHCEPFADRIVLPRGKRDEALAEYAQKYADRLADLARQAPDNWFNFYDFWKTT